MHFERFKGVPVIMCYYVRLCVCVCVVELVVNESVSLYVESRGTYTVSVG